MMNWHELGTARLQRHRRRPSQVIAATLVLLCWISLPVVAQDFQVVWVVVGEAEATAGNRPVRAGNHLFMASDLMSLSMKNVKVARLEVTPAVSQIIAGQRLCVSALSIAAYGPEGVRLESAPLSISIRQDQKQKLALSRDKTDFCVSPSEPGEYPIRFSSLLPAKDGTMRGAQLFLRVGTAVGTDATSSTPSGAIERLTRISSSALAPQYSRQANRP